MFANGFVVARGSTTGSENLLPFRRELFPGLFLAFDATGRPFVGERQTSRKRHRRNPGRMEMRQTKNLASIALAGQGRSPPARQNLNSCEALCSTLSRAPRFELKPRLGFCSPWRCIERTNKWGRTTRADRYVQVSPFKHKGTTGEYTAGGRLKGQLNHAQKTEALRSPPSSSPPNYLFGLGQAGTHNTPTKPIYLLNDSPS